MIGITINGVDEVSWRAGAYLGISADFEDEQNIIELREQAAAILWGWTDSPSA